MEIFFYQLETQSVEITLSTLLTKSLAAGWRVAVRGKSRSNLQSIDDSLWTGSQDGFIPHGIAGSEFDAEQPVLLSTEMEFANSAHALVAIDGAKISQDDLTKFRRVSIIFRKQDHGDVVSARELWKRFSTSGNTMRYYADERGNWRKRAEVNADP